MVSLPCHLSVLTTFAHGALRLSGRLRQRIGMVDTPVHPRERRACSASVAVGISAYNPGDAGASSIYAGLLHFNPGATLAQPWRTTL
jgi:hypothetical protein